MRATPSPSGAGPAPRPAGGRSRARGAPPPPRLDQLRLVAERSVVDERRERLAVVLERRDRTRRGRPEELRRGGPSASTNSPPFGQPEGDLERRVVERVGERVRGSRAAACARARGRGRRRRRGRAANASARRRARAERDQRRRSATRRRCATKAGGRVGERDDAVVDGPERGDRDADRSGARTRRPRGVARLASAPPGRRRSRPGPRRRGPRGILEKAARPSCPEMRSRLLRG